MALKTFCCCFSTEVGAFLIGIGTMLSLVGEWYYFQMVRTLLTFIATFAFFWMISYDSAESRCLFFWTWMLSTFAFYIINFFVASEAEGGFDADARATRQCEGLSDEYIQNLLFNTVDACKLASERYIVYEMAAITIPCVIFSAYCSAVLYAHWRNAADSDVYEKI